MAQCLRLGTRPACTGLIWEAGYKLRWKPWVAWICIQFQHFPAPRLLNFSFYFSEFQFPVSKIGIRMELTLVTVKDRADSKQKLDSKQNSLLLVVVIGVALPHRQWDP